MTVGQRAKFGLRDFYCFLGFMSSHGRRGGAELVLTPELLVDALQRNFNGFESEEEFYEIVKQFFSCLNDPDIERRDKSNSIPNIPLPEQDSPVFKPVPRVLQVALGEEPLNAALDGEKQRFKMIRDTTSDDYAAKMLVDTRLFSGTEIQGTLLNAADGHYSRRLEVVQLSAFPGDQTDQYRTRVMSKLQIAMESGVPVILRNCSKVRTHNISLLCGPTASILTGSLSSSLSRSKIYGAFYDLFNQLGNGRLKTIRTSTYILVLAAWPNGDCQRRCTHVGGGGEGRF